MTISNDKLFVPMSVKDDDGIVNSIPTDYISISNISEKINEEAISFVYDEVNEIKESVNNKADISYVNEQDILLKSSIDNNSANIKNIDSKIDGYDASIKDINNDIKDLDNQIKTLNAYTLETTAFKNKTNNAIESIRLDISNLNKKIDEFDNSLGDIDSILDTINGEVI